MSNPPVIQRITDLTIMDTVIRIAKRSQLGEVASLEECKICLKPVWFTAFFDGTGNNYKKDGNGLTDLGKTNYSNVAKLWQFGHGGDGSSYPRTTAAYIEGVGTPCPKVGDTGEGLDKALGMAAASNGEKRIDWMLRELKRAVDKQQRQVRQINLAVFGFSRGATQARAFVRMLTEKRPHVATLAIKDGNRLLWHETNSKGEYPELVVYFMGLFDTVASVGYGGSTLEKAASYALPIAGAVLGGAPGAIAGAVGGATLKAIDDGGHAAWANDLRIPGYVRRCVHFVASHEVREKFPCDSVRQNLALPSNCVEVFYPGMHSDVGGGYSRSAQEGRSNELANVALNNMFIEAWRAGVPLMEPSAVMADAGGLFEISEALERAWNNYMSQNDEGSKEGPPGGDGLQANIIWHMNRYYQWRESRRRRLNDGRLKKEGVDPYMAITDKEWSDDVEQLARTMTGYLTAQFMVSDQQKAIFNAYQVKNCWLGKQPDDIRRRFDLFFDHYVHDSIAGFKQQMAESEVGPAERSRWFVNRQYFVGKQGSKSLYWQYAGDKAESSGAKEGARTSSSETENNEERAAAAAHRKLYRQQHEGLNWRGG
ncbi:MAG: DUF2235 domain-containing protein [Burkholderiaceae bacterium]|jgi:hypothetical protein|nr:DUF2235 domain-containing protein [Burkholderiaceae bacterium]